MDFLDWLLIFGIWFGIWYLLNRKSIQAEREHVREWNNWVHRERADREWARQKRYRGQ